MPPVSAGTAYIDIVPDMSKFAARVQAGVAPAAKQVAAQTGAAVAKETAGLKSRLMSIGSGVGGLVAGAAIGTAVIGFVKSAVSAAEEAAQVARQTDAVLKSTGGAANVTASHIGDLADSLSKVAAVDDEVIQQGENVLLTFTKVRNEVGRGNDVFDQATAAALDLAAGMHQDLQSSIIMVGKALNDPIKGLTSLGRAGVQFDEQQKEMVKTLVESGDQLGAQKIILAELTKQFRGDAAANATASARMKVAFGNIAESVGGLLLPAMSALADVLEVLQPLLAFVAENVTVLFTAFAAWAAITFVPVLLEAIGGAIVSLIPGMTVLTGEMGSLAVAEGAATVAGNALAATMEKIGKASAYLAIAFAAFEDFKILKDIFTGNYGALSRYLEVTNDAAEVQEFYTHVIQPLTQAEKERALALEQSTRRMLDARFANQALGATSEALVAGTDAQTKSYRQFTNGLIDYTEKMARGRRVTAIVTDKLREGQGAFAGIRVSVNKAGDAIATWAGMTRRQVGRWATAIVGSAKEAINAFTGYTAVTRKSASEAVENANKQVNAAKQYREGAKEIIDSDYPAKIKAQILNAGPDIVRQWGLMSEKQKASFVDALQRTTAIMEQTRQTIVAKIGSAIDEVERMTQKPIEIKTDVDTSAATAHLSDWLSTVRNTHVTIPVDAIFSTGGAVGAQAGWRVPGYGGGDTVPAMLERGEWVINKSAVAKYGDAFFSRLNTMRFAGGGLVDDHGWGMTYTLSKQELIGAVTEAAKAQISHLFSIGGPPGLTPKAREYYGAIQTLFHPPIMSTGPSVRLIKGTNTWSQHSYGNALDITNSFASSPDAYKQSIANFLAEMGRLRRDIHYIAYNMHGWTLSSPWTAGVTSPHTNHVHADFYPQYGGTPRRRGGPVRAGQSYIVGEDGPEMFVPEGSGTVLPGIKVEVEITGGTLRLHRDSRAAIEDISADVATKVLNYQGGRR